MNITSIKLISGITIACIILMLSCYAAGYSLSIDWSVTTTGEVIEVSAWNLETPLTTHEITGNQYLLKEQYSGSEIKRNILTDKVLISLMWLGLCLVMAGSTYLKRYAFFASAALFALFLNRLNLFEIGLFGLQSKIISFIPFIILIVPLVIFHEYKKVTPFLIRFGSLVGLTALLVLLGVEQMDLFTDHMIAHSLFGFTVCGLLFLFIISEEIVFGVLYVTSSSKGGKNNHLHFVILSLIYVSNLTFYYLNRSGLYENGFYYFDPFILLAFSSIVALWSLKFKAGFLTQHLNVQTAYLISGGLGVITLLFLSHQIIRGNDAIYEAFHYFILYFHLGFGTLFFLYLIGNFIDPLIKGFPIHKIAYRERNFPYASARLGGFFAVLAFYFLANQEPYNLLKSGYYNYLSQVAETEGNELLAREYTLQSSFIGYNTHMANYTLGWEASNRGAEFASKTYFQNAAQRFPSPYAWVNYGNLDLEVNPNKVQALYEETLRNSASGEMENNLGVLHLEKGQLGQALEYFKSANPSQKWNDAPLVNSWYAYHKLDSIDSINLLTDYKAGNYGVKSNILTTIDRNTSLVFEYGALEQASYLHRQAYLLNGTYVFEHDSLSSFAFRELDASSDATFNNRLRKALALNAYRKGEVNQAFMVLDLLTATSHEYFKGEYLDAMGKLALDQEAYTLSLEFFEKALEAKYDDAILGMIEALARLGRKDEIPQRLLKELKKYPEQTERVNEMLIKLDGFEIPVIIPKSVPQLDSLSDEELVRLGRSNAFHEDQVIAVVDELDNREASGGYELLIDATEINPYSSDLLIRYAYAALNWNLLDYADQALEKLQELLPTEAYDSFLSDYETRKKAIESEEW